jgi:hypothetical protein
MLPPAKLANVVDDDHGAQYSPHLVRQPTGWLTRGIVAYSN